MSYINSFQRMEIKYKISMEQWKELESMIKAYVEPDKLYPYSDIYSIYFDTEQMEFLKQAVEKSWYREKLRMRWYQTGEEAPVYLEWKSKAKGITGKRRAQISLHGDDIEEINYEGDVNPIVIRQINGVIKRYPGIRPEVGINYHRLSLQGAQDQSIRLTVDKSIIKADLRDICTNKTEIENKLENHGENIISENEVLVEIKVAHSLPIWWVKTTGSLGIYPASFSKYKAACLGERMMM